MKPLTVALVLFSLACSSHAASPRACRMTTAARVNHVRFASTLHTVNHHAAAQPHFVVTAFAVPVAVPVAPFAPYWYGVSDYHAPLVPKLRLGTHFPEAPLREFKRAPDIDERQLRTSALAIQSVERPTERSIIALRCAACHGRTSPKQGLSLLDLPSLSAEDRLSAVRAVLDGSMPPENETPLSDNDRAAILRELTD